MIDLTSRQESLQELRNARETILSVDTLESSGDNPVEGHIREYLSKHRTTNRQLDDLLKMIQNISREDYTFLQTLPVSARTWTRRDHHTACFSESSLEKGGSDLLRTVRCVFMWLCSCSRCTYILMWTS